METEKAGVLELVEGPADVETAVADLVGKAGHDDIEGLGTGWIEATLTEEADDALGERSGVTVPRLPQELLRLGGIEVEQVETEDEELVAEAYHLVLADGDETAFGSSREGVGEPLVVAEDGLGLQHAWGLQLLDDGVGMVVGTALYAQQAREEEIELGAGIVLTHNGLPYPTLHEAEPGLPDNLSKIVAAHALKQGEQ